MEPEQKHERCRRCGRVLLNAALDITCPNACGAKYHLLCWERAGKQCRHIDRLPGKGLWVQTCATVFIILALLGVGTMIRRGWAAKVTHRQLSAQNGGTYELQEPRPIWNSSLKTQSSREIDSVTGLRWEVAGRLTFGEYLHKYEEKAPLITREAHRKACGSYTFYRSWVNDTDTASFTSARTQLVNELREAIYQWDDSLLAYRTAQLGKSVQQIPPAEELEAQREEMLGDIIALMRDWMPQREQMRDPAAEEFKVLQTLLTTQQPADNTADLVIVNKAESQLAVLLKAVHDNAIKLPDGSAGSVANLLLLQYHSTVLHFVLPSSATSSVTSAVMPSGLAKPRIRP